MKITSRKGMVNIDSEDLAYSNIRGMYQTDDGHGLGLTEAPASAERQLTEELEVKRKEIMTACAEIATSIYKLQDILDEDSIPS